MRPLKDRVSLTIDGDVLEKIKQYAEENDRSVSQYINIVLKKHIAKKESIAQAKENEIK